MSSTGQPDDGEALGSSVAMSVVAAVADAEGVDATALTPPLGEAIDPDALERVVRSSADATVEFEYRGWIVQVLANGAVSLRAP